MAGRSGRERSNEYGVAVAVQLGIYELQVVPRCRSLFPEFAAGPGVEPDVRSSECASVRFKIHVREHEHLASFCMLHDR